MIEVLLILNLLGTAATLVCVAKWLPRTEVQRQDARRDVARAFLKTSSGRELLRERLKAKG